MSKPKAQPLDRERFIQGRACIGTAEVALVYLGDIPDEADRLPKPWIAFRFPEREELLVPLGDAVAIANHVHALAKTARDYKLSDAHERLGVSWDDDED